MPMAAMSPAPTPACATAARHVATTEVHRFLRLVLDPAGAREVLREFLLRARDNAQALVEQDRPARGRALIDGQNMRHRRSLPCCGPTDHRIPARQGHAVARARIFRGACTAAIPPLEQGDQQRSPAWPRTSAIPRFLTIARETGKVTVEGLASKFNVTAQTIRRDLTELCDIGQLTRVHGGAMIPSGVIALGYEDRRSLASVEKDAMARLVAEQIPDGVSIFLNIGTTTEAVARALLKHRNLMVVTNNLNVANILATSPNSEVIVTGGILRRSDGALVGDVTAEFIGQFKVDYAIIASAAVDPDGSLLDYDFREVRVAQAIIKNARKSYLVADHTKFKMAAPVRIASLAELDGFFTDVTPPKTVVRLCADNDVFIRTVEHSARAR